MSLIRALVLLSLAACSQAQETSPTKEISPTKEQDNTVTPSSAPHPSLFRGFVHDEIRIWTSPFRKDSYSSKYGIPAVLMTGAMIGTDEETSEFPNTPDQRKWSGRVSQLGASYTLAGMAVTGYLTGRLIHNKKLQEASLLSGLALAHAQVVTFGIKQITNRERPFDFRAAGHGGLGFWRGGNSFPSGHTSGAFAIATVLHYEYNHQHRWVSFAAYGTASLVAASRLGAQKHWTSDAFVGGIVGFLVGRYVHHQHHDSSLDAGSPGFTHAERRYIPQASYSHGQITLIWQN